MRKSFDALCGLVHTLGHSATSGEVFVFLNRRRTHIKLLHWERGGLVLYYKRLEEGTFAAPEVNDQGALEWPGLVLMIEGIQIQKSRQLLRYQV